MDELDIADHSDTRMKEKIYETASRIVIANLSPHTHSSQNLFNTSRHDEIIDNAIKVATKLVAKIEFVKILK